MEIGEIKTWQWLVGGLIAGLLFSCVYTWSGPAFDTQPRDTIEQGEFENNAMALSKYGYEMGMNQRLVAQYHKGQPMLRDVTVHPPLANDPKHDWVTGRTYYIGLKPVDPTKVNGPEKVYEEWKLFKYPAAIPYEPGYTLRAEKKLDKNAASLRNLELADLKKSLGGQTQFPTVAQYLKAVATLPGAEFKYQSAWWEKPAAVWSLPAVAGLLIFGVAFPLSLSVMNHFGMVKAPIVSPAKPKPVEPAPPSRKPVMVAPQPPVPQPAVAAPPSLSDSKKYGGEFYPVVKTAKE